MIEIIDIPKYWQVKRLGDVCDNISLNGIKIKQKDYLKEGKYPVVDQGQKLIGGYFDNDNFVVPNDPPYIIFGDHTKVKKFIDFNFIAGADGVKVLKPHSIYDSRFFFYLIHTVKIPDKGYARHFQFLEKAEIPLPPLPEQQAIVAKIEELFSDLDNGKQQLQTAQQQIKVYRQSLLKWAFEGRLTNKNVKDGELPKGWEKTTLGQIISISSGNGLTRNKRNDEGTYLVYGGNGVTGKHSEYLFEDEQLIIGRVGVHCGNAYITKPKSWVTDNAFVVSFNKKYVSKRFLLHLIKVLNLNKYSVSTAQPVISQGKLYPIEVSIPSPKEQQLIVDELESKLTVCDKIEETISQSLLQVETLRQSILKKAFEGKLVQTEEIAEKKKEII